MSEVPSRGHRGGRNTTQRGRGGGFCGRGTQRGSLGRPDAQYGRWSRGGTQGRGLPPSLSHHHERSRGSRRGSSGRARIHTGNRNVSRFRNERDNESEGSHDSSHQRRNWRARGWQRERSRGGWRGGKRNNNDSTTDPQLDYESLLLMLKKDPDELVIDITSDRYLPVLESLLNQFDLPDKNVIAILRVLAKACDSETSRAFLIILLNKLINSVYLSSALTRYINCLAYASEEDGRDIEDEIKCMIKLFMEILKKLPTSFPHLPLPNLLLATTALMDKGQIRNTEIKSCVENLITLRDQMAEKVQKEEKAKKTKRRIDPGDEAGLLDNEDPPDDYRRLSVIPQQDDIHPNGPVFIRRNKVEGSYDGPGHYLDVQFRLLREDFIRPLRDGIAALSESSGIDRKPSQDIRVYNGVRILKPVCTSKGVTYQISFDVSKLRRILWENSKRLIYGSLLCLSKDNFETFILATVEDRKPELLKEGLIEVRFTDINADLVNTTYQMAETTAYFEAYRHVLEGLQEINFFHFPFERYIVESKPDVQAPLYLRNTSKEVVYDLTCIMRSRSDTIARSQLGYNPRQKGRSVKILDMDSWPSAEDLELDSSQLKAVQIALTKEFAIIQGPPGTGKTYIGLKVAKVLLNNKTYWNTHDLHDNRLRRWHVEPITKIWRRPILLVCYTNHALDQFLEGIYKFHPEGIVRVGGQSQSWMLEECNIRSIKETIRQHHQDVCRYYRRLRRFRQREREREYLGDYDDFGYYDSDEELYIDDDVEPEFPEINSELQEIYLSQEWIRSKFKDLYDELKRLLSKLNEIDDDIQKIKTTVMNENKLFSECSIMSRDNYDSIVSRFKDEDDGKKIKIKPDVMHYWLGLLTNTLDFIESGSTFVNPVAVYPLSEARRIKSLNSTKELVFHNVRPGQGIDGGYNGSYEINGKDSYILIPNRERSSIDTRYSMTIVLYVFPTSSFGPIVTFHQNGVIGIQIQIQIQGSEQNFRRVLSVTFNRRDGVRSEPLLANETLEINEWHYIAASYDYHSGILRVYQNGNMVGEQKNASMEIASHLPVHIGSLDLPNNVNVKPSFRGRVSSLQFFPEAISQEQIRAIVGIPEEDVIESEEKVLEEAEGEKFAKDKPQGNVVFEADRMEELRKLDVDIDEILHLDRRQQKSNPQPHQDSTPDKTYDNGNQGEWQMQCPKFLGSRVKRVLKKEMEKTDMMTEDEANKITDLWKLSRQDKWRLYRYWIETLCETYRINARRIHPRFEECAERIKALHRQEDLTILRKATIIGMTTTGAAKFRELIQEIQPRITIVEEAAEVLESHIVTSLTPGCEHLILIGDHQQLRPSPNVYKLAKDYKLDVSLFERMVNNGMDFQTLRKQHRMRPEIAQMMEPIYEDLENHESVSSFENIKGVNKNIFFIEHNELEDFVDEGKSRSNIHEAKYLAALCRYFILQGYDQSMITILTMYVGQLNQLKNETSERIFHGVRICAVDNFQGEENDIILLSLVRSNEEGNIGFLRISNRVCVALSRARKGFYCIGNLELMCRKEKLWATIVEDMRERGNVGPSLILMCQNHPNSKIYASTATDFRHAPQGGCSSPCHARLDCGHACRLSCHPRNPDHTEYECYEPCTKTCDPGHKCKKRCYQECGPCPVLMQKIIPPCNHVAQLPCHLDPAKAKCHAACKVKLNCGHQCEGSCLKCFKGRLHIKCEQNCERTLVCGHECLEICAIKCPPCSQECENECVHQECSKKCGEPCEPCKKACTWKCRHYTCPNPCGDPCNRPRCNKPCEKTLSCNHRCIGMCGEPCPKVCRVCDKDKFSEGLFGNNDDPDAKFVELRPCGHVIEVNAMDALMDECCNGLEMIGIQLKRCPACGNPIRTCPRYGNIIKTDLQDVEKVKAEFFDPDFDIKAEAAKLRSLISFSDKFEDRSREIQTGLEHNFGKENLEMHLNKISLFNLLSKMLEEINIFKLYVEDPVQVKLKESLENEIMALDAREKGTSSMSGQNWRPLRLYQYSDQELEEIRDEILRVQLMVSYRLLNVLIQEQELTLDGTDEDDMNLIGQELDSCRRIDEEALDLHMETLDQIRTSYDIWTPVEAGPIERKDTMEITNSIEFSKENWYKRPDEDKYETLKNFNKRFHT